jgi:hypothetical protein
VLGQKATCGFPEPSFGAVALYRTADFFGGREAEPDRAICLAAAGFDHHQGAGRTKTGPHEQKLRALGQLLQGRT